MTDRPDVVARVTTSRGELVLRRAGNAFELIENGTFLMDTRDGRSRGALDDPRVCVVKGDIASQLEGVISAYDIVCLDIDNGPDWTVTEANSALYDEAGTELVIGAARPGGLVAVWAASASPKYEQRLRRHLDDFAVIEVPVAHGNPDVIYLGRRPSGEADVRP